MQSFLYLPFYFACPWGRFCTSWTPRIDRDAQGPFGCVCVVGEGTSRPAGVPPHADAAADFLLGCACFSCCLDMPAPGVRAPAFLWARHGTSQGPEYLDRHAAAAVGCSRVADEEVVDVLLQKSCCLGWLVSGPTDTGPSPGGPEAAGGGICGAGGAWLVTRHPPHQTPPSLTRADLRCALNSVLADRFTPPAPNPTRPTGRPLRARRRRTKEALPANPQQPPPPRQQWRLSLRPLPPASWPRPTSRSAAAPRRRPRSRRPPRPALPRRRPATR